MAPTISLDAARRIALGAQGLARPPAGAAPGARQFARAMTTLGLVQLDSVNVCVRSHYMPFYARLGPYDDARLDTWLNTPSRHFEYWAHEACVLPVADHPLWRWRMRAWRPWKSAIAVMKERPELVGHILSEVEARGPLSVRDLDLPSERRGSWWGYGPGKLVLETLFGEGRLTARRGKGFARLYDLPERAIPQAVLAAEELDAPTAQRELLLRATRHLGLGTAHDIADYHRLKMTTARPLLAELAAEGVIEAVDVPGWKGPVYRHSAARRPRTIRGATLLSPFDPVVWNRQRAERLFGFRYRIEIYTPAAKRTHGYYVLPFLLDGTLAARVDLKADRQAGVLRVPAAFVETGHDAVHVARALSAELDRFAAWRGLGRVVLGRKGNLMRPLRRARR